MDAVLALADAPEPVRDYTGFPDWFAMLVQSNREEQSAHRLKSVHVHVYLPQWTRQVRCGGAAHRFRARLCAAIPGMLFVPVDMLDRVGDRAALFDFANVRGWLMVGAYPAVLRKADIEKIRELEARLNLPPPPAADRVHQFRIGQSVRFTNELYAISWGTGAVFEIASAHRIGLEVDHLFGRKGKVYVTASEIEPM